MRIVKLVGLGIGAALVSLTAMSSAGPNPNVTGVTADGATSIVEGEYLDFTVQGTGSCVLQLSNIETDGKEYEDSTYGKFPHKLPTPIDARQYTPGSYTLIVTTLASPDAPNCVAGQKVSIKYTVIAKPHCPTGWQQTYLNENTGAISCAPYNPTGSLACKGKSVAFFNSASNVCQSGCENIAY